jgi:hypothetical protein
VEQPARMCQQPSKLVMRVRFPSPALFVGSFRYLGTCGRAERDSVQTYGLPGAANARLMADRRRLLRGACHIHCERSETRWIPGVSGVLDVVYSAVSGREPRPAAGMAVLAARAGDLSAVPGALTPGTADKPGRLPGPAGDSADTGMPHLGINHGKTGTCPRHAGNSSYSGMLTWYPHCPNLQRG